MQHAWVDFNIIRDYIGRVQAWSRARCSGVLCSAAALCVCISPRHTQQAVLSKPGAKITPMNFTLIDYYRP